MIIEILTLPGLLSEEGLHVLALKRITPKKPMANQVLFYPVAQSVALKYFRRIRERFVWFTDTLERRGRRRPPTFICLSYKSGSLNGVVPLKILKMNSISQRE